MVNFFSSSAALVAFFNMSVVWATTPPMVSKDIASTGYGLENAASAKNFATLFHQLGVLGDAPTPLFLAALVRTCNRTNETLL